jgi:signal transduction histidine kinase
MVVTLLVAFSWAIGVFLSTGADDVRALISNTVMEYGEIDRTHLANLTNSKEVQVKEGSAVFFFRLNNQELKSMPESFIEGEYSLEWGNDEIYPFVGLMKVQVQDTAFIIEIPKALRLTLIVITFMFLAFFIGGFLLLNFYMKKVRKADLMQFSSEKNGLQTLITSVLSENLHHEMKTPLCSISCELNNVRDVLTNVKFKPEKMCGSCGIVNVKTDVEQSFFIIEENVKNIYNVIETIKMSKNAKHNDDLKSVYDIAHNASVIITSTSKVKNFKIKVDERLKLFKLKNFKSEDLTNIFINHLKNSIEANATRIVFDCPSSVDSKGFLTLFIVDNGNGIPEDAKSKIYELHFSTKDDIENRDSLRGIGLFLSREILRTYARIGKHHGDEYVYETSKEGTTFGLVIPAELDKNTTI